MCLGREIPAHRHRRGQRLARIGIIERGGLVPRHGAGPLGTQPAPDIQFPGRPERYDGVVERMPDVAFVTEVVGMLVAELAIELRQ